MGLQSLDRDPGKLSPHSPAQGCSWRQIPDSNASVPSFLCCPAFPDGCSFQPQAGVRAGPHRPPLPALGSPTSSVGFSHCSCWPSVSAASLESKVVPNAVCSSAGMSWLGGPEGTPGFSPSSPLTAASLRNFPQSGQGNPGGFHSVTAALEEPGGPTCPALSPAGTRAGAHTGSAVSQLQPQGFPPILVLGVG